MAKHGVVRTDKLFGTDNRAGLVSVRYQPEDTMKAIDNGNVVKIEALEDGSREVYKGVDPVAGDPIEKLVLIASPEVMYDEHMRNLDEFENAEGGICRGYHMHVNDIFSLTKEALIGVEKPEVGNVVEVVGGTKLSVSASATDDSAVIGTIIGVDVVGRYTYYVIQIA